MRIGIDIDGVLTDEHRFIIDNGTKFFNEMNIPYVFHNDIYDSKEVFEVTEEQYNLFWDKYLLDYSINFEIRPYASEIIKKLNDENNKIFIITARSFTTYENENKEKMQKIVKDWLSKNNVVYNQIIFSEEKAKVCKKLGIDIMIEDKPENVIAVSKEIPVLCYDHPYNSSLKNENIFRCYSWYDIYSKIKEISAEPYYAKELRKALMEYEQDKKDGKLKTYNSTEKLFDEWDKEDAEDE